MKSEGAIQIPGHLQRHYSIWRLAVVEKVATLHEIRTFWDINDVMRANELLDIQQDAEWQAANKKPGG